VIRVGRPLIARNSCRGAADEDERRGPPEPLSCVDLRGATFDTGRDKADAIDVVTDSGKCPGLGASVGYHTTIVSKALLRRRWHLSLRRPWRVSTGSEELLCFRELTVEDLKMWERQIKRTHKWPQSMKALRLDKCKEEAERQGVDIPPWYLLDGVTSLQVARPYNPVDETEMMD